MRWIGHAVPVVEVRPVSDSDGHAVLNELVAPPALGVEHVPHRPAVDVQRGVSGTGVDDLGEAAVAHRSEERGGSGCAVVVSNGEGGRLRMAMDV